jgi:hypothetical protein
MKEENKIGEKEMKAKVKIRKGKLVKYMGKVIETENISDLYKTPNFNNLKDYDLNEDEVWDAEYVINQYNPLIIDIKLIEKTV